MKILIINIRILREIVILVTLSFLAGFSYTFVTKKGFFSNKEDNRILEIINLEKAKELHLSKKAIFIDSRHEFEYNMGHIEDAINIPLSRFNEYKNKLEEIPKSNILVVYCDGTECNSSFELGAKLFDSGYKNVRIFYGGWEEWKKNKLPTIPKN